MGNKETVIELYGRMSSAMEELDFLRNSSAKGAELDRMKHISDSIYTMKHILSCLEFDIPRDEYGMLHSKLIEDFHASLTSKQREGLLSCVYTLQPQDRAEEEYMLRELRREFDRFNFISEMGITKLTKNLLDLTDLIRRISGSD